MKKLGDPFDKYESFAVDHLSFPNTRVDFANIQKFGAKVSDPNELGELMPEPTHRLAVEKSVRSGLRVLTADKLTDEARRKLKEIDIQVAPVATVYPIDPEQKDLAESIRKTMKYWDYYAVECGLNVCVGREATIPEVNFEVDLRSSGKLRTDVTTHSLAPTDAVKTITIVDGKIGISISKLLKLIPGPVGQVLSDVLTIDLNPIPFKWNLTRYEIDTSGPLNYKARWHIYNTDNVQSFNPLMVIRAKKKLTTIFAKARITYALKMKGILPHIEVYSDERKITILPIGE